jgi:hypothetical protein
LELWQSHFSAELRAPVSWLEVFTKHFGKFQDSQNCRLIQRDHDISCVAFLASDSLMLLTFAVLSDSDMAMVSQDDYGEFIYSVFCGQFGKTKLFFNHIVIPLNVISVLFARHIPARAEIEIWSCHCGHLSIVFRNANSSAKIYKLFQGVAEPGDAESADGGFVVGRRRAFQRRTSSHSQLE